VGGWRIFSFITNAVEEHRAVDLDLHRRRRGGASEGAIRQLNGDVGMNRAPENFFGNSLCWLVAMQRSAHRARPSLLAGPAATKVTSLPQPVT
jgi:hypothetical protein